MLRFMCMIFFFFYAQCISFTVATKALMTLGESNNMKITLKVLGCHGPDS